MDKDAFKLKRILSVDYGLKRIGIAICDPLHITVTPLMVLDVQKGDYFTVITDLTVRESVGAVVVGVPYRLDGKETEVLAEIKKFIEELKSKIEIPVIEYDESFSSVRAGETMFEIGYKKKKRAKKGERDKLAAAIILRDFLREMEY